jgi:hypothetical protein
MLDDQPAEKQTNEKKSERRRTKNNAAVSLFSPGLFFLLVCPNSLFSLSQSFRIGRELGVKGSLFFSRFLRTTAKIVVVPVI